MKIGAVSLVVLLGACSGKTKGVEDARKHMDSGSGRDPTLPPPTGNGDVQLRVEWKDVPIEARASAGRTPCNTPRAPSVAPTTTWGVPDIVVMIDVPPSAVPKNIGSADPKATGSSAAQATGSSSAQPTGSAAAPPESEANADKDPKAASTGPVTTAALAPREARIVLDRCALSPRIAVARDKLVLASAAEAPAKLALTKSPDPFGTKGDAGTTRLVYLPVAGHSVATTIEANSAYHVEIATDDGKGRDAEDAWVIVATTPYFAITEPNGQVLLRDVPAGTYTATAWLPPRAGQPARIAHAPVTVTDGGLADITLDISK
ncbi:MAG TPA: hypothetical protein VL326_29760 [Kofleriaceae bacterium]|nr:hypothetical protein [Kofleriaceae bacterium]